MSVATSYKWRAKFSGMDVSMMARMKELAEENRRLKKLYAEEKLKAEIRKEALELKWWWGSKVGSARRLGAWLSCPLIFA